MQFQAHIRSVEKRDLKYILLDYFKAESSLLLLDGNTSNGDSFDWVIAAGVVDEISVGVTNAFDELQDFHNKHKDWIFGSLSYDLKNGLEKLESTHPDGIQAPDLHFFLPKYLFVFKENQLAVHHTQVKKNLI